MENLNKEAFKEKVFDYEKGEERKSVGGLPCIVDFYADWCGPCQALTPVLNELSTGYAGRVNVFKVNVEEQPELAQNFRVSGVPSLLFVPKDGEPKMIVGALPKAGIEKRIRDILGVRA